MAHEQSETVQAPSGKWVNVYGRDTAKKGKRLPQDATGVGHEEYETVEQAVDAAKRRSKQHGVGRRGYAHGGMVAGKQLSSGAMSRFGRACRGR